MYLHTKLILIFQCHILYWSSVISTLHLLLIWVWRTLVHKLQLSDVLKCVLNF